MTANTTAQPRSQANSAGKGQTQLFAVTFPTLFSVKEIVLTDRRAVQS